MLKTACEKAGHAIVLFFFCFMACNLKIFLSGSLVLFWFGFFLSSGCFFPDGGTGVLKALID